MKSPVRYLPLCASLVLILTVPARSEDRRAPDLDGDGIPNIVDPDIDNDGIPNSIDPNVDGGIALTGPFAGRYIGDHLDNDNPAEMDIDGDELRDDSLGELDIDGDSLKDDDVAEEDIDGDGRRDDSPTELDIDGDGRKDDDLSEDDIDGDGFDDNDDANEDDIDGDGISDDDDDDIDGDDRLNSSDDEDDTDGDGLKDDDPDEHNDDGDSLDDRDDDDDDNDGLHDEDDLDHHPEDDEHEVEMALTAQAAAPSGSRVRVKVQQMAFGETKFEVDGRGLPAGDYQIVVDGISRGVLTMSGSGSETEAEAEYETGPDNAEERLLDFEIIGLSVEIVRDGVIYFSGTVPTPPSVGSDDDEESDDVPAIPGSGSTTGDPAPDTIMGLSLTLDDGGTLARLDFLTETNGQEVDLVKTDTSGFTFVYEKVSSTTATIVVTFDASKRDEYSLNFAAKSFVRSEYKDGVLNDVDVGLFQ
ncbi:MAG: hypothetical protein R3F07_06800 [Opitutaceae bacterium]